MAPELPVCLCGYTLMPLSELRATGGGPGLGRHGYNLELC